jgi:predicted RNA-binding protein with EMAP domain
MESNFERMRAATEKQKNDRHQLLEKMNDLVDLESGFTDWEVNFVEDMANRRKNFGDITFFESLTQKQKDLINKIHDEKC